MRRRELPNSLERLGAILRDVDAKINAYSPVTRLGYEVDHRVQAMLSLPLPEVHKMVSSWVSGGGKAEMIRAHREAKLALPLYGQQDDYLDWPFTWDRGSSPQEDADNWAEAFNRWSALPTDPRDPGVDIMALYGHLKADIGKRQDAIEAEKPKLTRERESTSKWKLLGALEILAHCGEWGLTRTEIAKRAKLRRNMLYALIGGGKKADSLCKSALEEYEKQSSGRGPIKRGNL